MTTYWAKSVTLLLTVLTVIFLLTFEQMQKKVPAPTIQTGSAARPDVCRRLKHVGRLKPLTEFGSYTSLTSSIVFGFIFLIS